MKLNKIILIFILIGLIRFSNHACGPAFPQPLLTDRNSTLKYLPDGSFESEVSHLLPPQKDTFTSDIYYYWNYNSIKSREKIEVLWFGNSGEELIQRMRCEKNPETAYRSGSGLPEEIRSYTAGAVAYSNNDFKEAIKWFTIVLDLPEGNRQKTGLWAQYMTGRCYNNMGDSQNAIRAFKSVRAIALQGGIDSLKLAVASFGEEARIYMENNNYPEAIYLYAQQAAHGSTSGVSSLLFVSRKIVSNDSLLEKTLPDTLCQKLIFTYLYCYENESNETDSTDSEKLLRIIDIIEQSEISVISGIDKLAAAAYRAGRYDLSERMCKKSNTGLSFWVRAKLDLHKGDLKSAAFNYHKVIKYLQTDNTIIFNDSYYEYENAINRVLGELSALNLAGNEFAAAIKLLYKSSPVYWIDAAYVAEKILTVEELKKFVDENVRLSENDSTKAGSNEFSQNPSTALRYLLARRLLRENHFKDALKYFDDPRIKEKAELYIKYYLKATTSKGMKGASYWYKTALFARYDGMELLGYELDPDYFIFQGNSNGLNSIDSSTISCDYVSSEEYRRLNKNKASQHKRFSYRYLAIDCIQKAVSQVPPRSQAYVAMLSKAYWWICNKDFASAQDLYMQYIKNGAYVPWAFDKSSPDPDFDAAQKMVKTEKLRKLKKRSGESQGRSDQLRFQF
jgi:cellulose synthase operon protein C